MVSECSFFHRYIIQVFKDFVIEDRGVNNFISEARRWNICP